MPPNTRAERPCHSCRGKSTQAEKTKAPGHSVGASSIKLPSDMPRPPFAIVENFQAARSTPFARLSPGRALRASAEETETPGQAGPASASRDAAKRTAPRDIRPCSNRSATRVHRLPSRSITCKLPGDGQVLEFAFDQLGNLETRRRVRQSADGTTAPFPTDGPDANP